MDARPAHDRRSRATCAAALVLLGSLATQAYETDPYTNRHVEIADSTPILDEKMNAALADIAARWDEGEDEWRVVNAIYHRLGGHHWVDRLERWAIKSERVEKLRNSRKQSIYHGLPLYTTRVAGIFGFGPTIKLNGVYVGTDKIGHFLSQGRKFYRRYQRFGDEARAARRSVQTERGIFGKLMTGVFSNADVVANYEGYRFYRSLFETGVVDGKPAIFRWDNGRPVQQRAFSFADHVNAFWDEALNPNDYDRWLGKRVRERLLEFCDQYRRTPHVYVSGNADRLYARYRHIGVRDTRALRPEVYLERNCPASEDVVPLYATEPAGEPGDLISAD